MIIEITLNISETGDKETDHEEVIDIIEEIVEDLKVEGQEKLYLKKGDFRRVKHFEELVGSFKVR